MSGRKRLEQAREFECVNGEAAWIILRNSDRYDGLPAIWAQAWVDRHGTPLQPREQAWPSFAERLEAAESKQRLSALKARRLRWRKRKWLVSAKGNYYAKVRGGIFIVIFAKGPKWQVGISDREAEMQFPRGTYATVDEAKEGAFDCMLIAESRRVANPEILANWRTTG